MVGFGQIAWHVKSFNSRAIGIEMAGREANGFPEAQLQATANLTAYLCRHYEIPPIWSKTGSGKGVCQHKDLGVAGGGHHDFTASTEVWKRFLKMVNEAYILDMPPGWGRD
jgi:N-acetyl-anhydromuramyl-L-alanine amidase AmpD